ncbi:MAG: RIO1/ZK632.3/MJ0444 family protein [uncultured Propionibacteriaceae bacterium]|uniref:non-specific serine/threonine protein kinase n=1 Tax=uncultured Propionibacteriaceae bacterium TaxID=257457 RepID=A0A6J4PLL4_9ACTN|nr:MAG: RIO1/ZK632.3/MJ0444 family protein [uncultured Propionibacteriaceae bacterium]
MSDDSFFTSHVPTQYDAGPAEFAPIDFVATAELEPGQRWSTWDDIGVLAGPQPWPEWVITADAAIDTELGILKTGKEAEVFLLERATAEQACVLAAKRYRGHDERLFHRDSGYQEGRKMRNSRDRRAAAKGTRWGRTVEAGHWALAEFGYLSQLWSAGLPVPYPVQLDGTEILMEFITLADGTGAPRLAQTRPDAERLASYWEQLTQAMTVMAELGITHGDLSAFNILAAEDRIVIIDLPQAVDIVANPQGMTFLARDCRNVCSWFSARGLEVDADDLLAGLVGQAW